jgi:TolB-like protein
MVATVSPWEDQSVAQTGAQTNAQTPGGRPRDGYRWAVGSALCIGLVVIFLWAFPFHGKVGKNNPSASPAIAPQPQKSIAVLPFLDLTEEMNQEPFADGMTEELIDKLSKIRGAGRLPRPVLFQGQLWPRSHGTPQITIADIAKTMGVAYIPDGACGSQAMPGCASTRD